MRWALIAALALPWLLAISLAPLAPFPDYTFSIHGHRFGFAEYILEDLGFNPTGVPVVEYCTDMHLGPWGEFRVPVSAWTGWGIVLVLPTIPVLVALAVKSLRAAQRDLSVSLGGVSRPRV